MTEHSISLPPEELAYAQHRVKHGDFGDVSSFVSALVRRDREARDRLLAAIDEGESSGDSEYSLEEILEQAKESARSRAA